MHSQCTGMKRATKAGITFQVRYSIRKFACEVGRYFLQFWTHPTYSSTTPVAVYSDIMSACMVVWTLFAAPSFSTRTLHLMLAPSLLFTPTPTTPLSLCPALLSFVRQRCAPRRTRSAHDPPSYFPMPLQSYRVGYIALPARPASQR